MFATLLLSVAALAQDKDPVVKCKVQAQEYANNQLPYAVLPDFPLSSVDTSLTSMSAAIKGGTFKVTKNYFVQLSGIIMKPGNPWKQDASMMLIEASLVKQNDDGKAQVLNYVMANSITVRSPKQVEKIQAGEVLVESSIGNPEYFALRGSFEQKVPQDMVTGISFVCKLVR